MIPLPPSFSDVLSTYSHQLELFLRLKSTRSIWRFQGTWESGMNFSNLVGMEFSIEDDLFLVRAKFYYRPVLKLKRILPCIMASREVQKFQNW